MDYLSVRGLIFSVEKWSLSVIPILKKTHKRRTRERQNAKKATMQKKASLGRGMVHTID
jgi:hypothetical protein